MSTVGIVIQCLTFDEVNWISIVVDFTAGFNGQLDTSDHGVIVFVLGHVDHEEAGVRLGK